MKQILASIALGSLFAACGTTSSSADDDGVTVDAASDLRTLDTCTTSIAAGVPAFYRKYFACSTITAAADGTVTIASDDLPPHPSYYYADTDPNHVEFDRRDGDYFPNPNRLAQQSVRISIPPAPVAKGVTIDASVVDGYSGTSDLEYPLGSIGVALDAVSLYSGVAGPGDDIAKEKYTFDSYEAHPSPDGAYHYHAPTPGPLEVLAHAGLPDTEVYGILCDGTVVLGCTELDGSAVAGALDAQGGHVGDIGDGDATYFSGRYHVHVCATTPGHPYTPEIQYYTTCGR